jgi:hypothetical protein
MALGIAILFLIPVTIIVSATDTTPPIIEQLWFDPNGFTLYGPLYFWVDCIVNDPYTDPNSGVADVRVIMTGPAGFTPVNESLPDYGGGEYYFEYINDAPLLGTYYFHIVATDFSGNSVTSDQCSFYLIAQQNTIYVDESNTAGPWDGTAAHPLLTITEGITAVYPYGTVFVKDGVYHETLHVDKPMNIVGQDRQATIIDGNFSETYNNGIEIAVNNVNISYMAILNTYNPILPYGGPKIYNVMHCTIAYSHNFGIYLQGTTKNIINDCAINNEPNNAIFFADGISFPVSNKTITNCTIQNNNKGIHFLSYYAYHNYFYRNNFINNTIDVYNVGSQPNYWDNGAVGNYWDCYRSVHPNAHIVPSTGTWDQPFTINSFDIDHHPWVYPNGFIDHTAPTATVVYPNGGETVSSTINILWTANDDLSPMNKVKIHLEYSGDNGTIWHTIVSNITNTGTYAWNTLTVPSGTQYRIRVNATDEFQNIGSDVSDGVFTVLNNHAPNIPSNPSPTYGATGVDCNADLSWTGGDQDQGDVVTYDVYFGTTNPPQKIVNNQSATSYEPGTMNFNTQYYWKIVSWDNHGASATGPLWIFHTVTNNPPNVPSNPSPANNATNISINTTLSWIGGDPDSGDTITYDVYFGTTNSPPKVAGNQSATMYNPGTLGYLTTYYWRVVCWDDHNVSTAGPLWHFTTTSIPPAPVLNISSITGGFSRVNAIITNNGNADATNVKWNITLTGGLIVLGKQTSGTIDKISAGNSTFVKSSFLFGFAKTTITVHAVCDEGSEVTRTVQGIIFLVFVIGVTHK